MEALLYGLRKWILSLVGTVVAVAISYQWIDRPVALFFHNTVARPETFAKLTYAPDPMVPLACFVFVVFGLVSLSGRVLSRIENCTLLCSLSLIVAELTKIQLKLVFGRTWPDTFRDSNPSFLRDGVYGFNFFHGGHAYASFPSGHTTLAFAMATSLSDDIHRTWATVGLYGLATGVAVSRVYQEAHWVSDVVGGAALGIASAKLVSGRWRVFGLTPPRFLIGARGPVIGWSVAFHE